MLVPEGKEGIGELAQPGGVTGEGAGGAKSVLQATLPPFDESVGLGVVRASCSMINPVLLTHGTSFTRGEMSAIV